MNNNIRHIVMDTIAAAGADLVVANQLTRLGNNSLGRFLDYEPGATVKKSAVTAETAGVVTYTPVGAMTANTTYSIVVKQYRPGREGSGPKLVTATFSVTTGAVAPADATALCNLFRSQIFGGGGVVVDVSGINVTASGAATLILTAAAGSPVLSAGEYRNNPSLYMAASVPPTTQGADTQGTPADMAALGVTATLTDTAYTMYSIVNNQHIGTNGNTLKANQVEKIYIWLAENAANFAALEARMDEWVQSFASGGAVVDPELVAIA